MQYRRLGNSNLKVSALCLGTMMFGKQTPLEDAARIVASAREHGLNFIDTADVYNQGQSEKDVGKLLTGMAGVTYTVEETGGWPGWTGTT